MTLTAKQLNKIEESVGKAVELHVNGKIKDIDTKLSEYIKDDMKWKVRAEPVVVAFENSKWSLKIFVSVVKFLAMVVPATGGYYIIKKFLQ